MINWNQNLLIYKEVDAAFLASPSARPESLNQDWAVINSIYSFYIEGYLGGLRHGHSLLHFVFTFLPSTYIMTVKSDTSVTSLIHNRTHYD